MASFPNVQGLTGGSYNNNKRKPQTQKSKKKKRQKKKNPKNQNKTKKTQGEKEMSDGKELHKYLTIWIDCMINFSIKFNLINSK